jgi:hypothetical protein
VIAGQPLPKGPLVAKSKCEGTVEDHRNIALDVRELIRKHVFDQPVGSTFRLSIAYPWLRVMRLVRQIETCISLPVQGQSSAWQVGADRETRTPRFNQGKVPHDSFESEQLLMHSLRRVKP